MKRSKAVYLFILPAIALMACEDTPSATPARDEVKHCVDENGSVVEELNCDIDAAAPEQKDASAPHTTTVYRYRWYYGGNMVLSPGTRVSGGSFEPSIGRSYSSPSTISRGGFGGIGRGGVSVGAGE